MLFIQPYNGRVLDTQVIFRKRKIIWGCETFWGLLNYDGVASLRMGPLKQKFTLTLLESVSSIQKVLRSKSPLLSYVESPKPYTSSLWRRIKFFFFLHKNLNLPTEKDTDLDSNF